MSDIEQAQASAASTSGEPDPAARWAERGIGGDWQHRFFDWLIRHRGKRRAYQVAYIVTFWYVLLYPSVRRRCRFYLGRRFPEHRGWGRRFLDTYRLVRTFATTLVDMMALRVLGPGELAGPSADHHRLLEMCPGDRGFILLQSHVGCWQMGMGTLAHFPKHVSLMLIPEPQTLAILDPREVSVIDPRQGLASVMAMTEALLRGEIVVMMGDRIFGEPKNSVKVRFLGSSARFPVTPYRLASATGMPVVVTMAPKVNSRSYKLYLNKVIHVPPGLGRNAEAYAPYAQEFADCLEEFVREYPWQFYNFYDLWHDGDEGVESDQ